MIASDTNNPTGQKSTPRRGRVGGIAPISATTVLLLVSVVLSATASATPAAVLAARTEQRQVEVRAVKPAPSGWQRGCGERRTARQEPGGGAIEAVLADVRCVERARWVDAVLVGYGAMRADAGVGVWLMNVPPPTAA